MLGITSVLATIVLAGIVVGICAKNRTVRIVAWCVSGICVLGFVLFVVFALPRLLQR
jgi:hypothetical protein